MTPYYMCAVLFVIVTNYAVLFLRMDEGPFEEIFSIPFVLLTLFIAAVTLMELRKLKKKVDQNDAETRD